MPSISPRSANSAIPCEGRDYYQKKLAEGKTSKEAIRALKRRISDVVYRQLRADTAPHQSAEPLVGPGRHPGRL